MSKVLGILGGMGPLATARLFEDLVLSTDAKKDQDHIRILMDNNVMVPDRTAYILDKSNEDPRKELIKSAKLLEDMGADFIIMPCNTAHYFYDDIQKEINIPLINMIEESAKELSKMENLKKVGIYATEGTIEAKIYDKVFEKYGIEIVSPSEENQKYITEIIYNIKEGIEQESLDGFYKVKEELDSKGVDAYITGCTEMSISIDMYDLKGNIIDPMRILADRSIEYAGKKVNRK